MIRILCADISSADDQIYGLLYEKATPERKSQADRYPRQEDKLRCVTADALLKKALSSEEYRVRKNDFGKPYIKDREDFFYSLSHSGRYVVIAWGDTEVGVDVQRQDASVNREAIASRFFASDEQAYARGDILRFFEIWTKKESYLKYTGRGLRLDLRSFSVLSPEPGIRYEHRMLKAGYSLSLCMMDKEYTFTQLDIRQLR